MEIADPGKENVKPKDINVKQDAKSSSVVTQSTSEFDTSITSIEPTLIGTCLFLLFIIICIYIHVFCDNYLIFIR